MKFLLIILSTVMFTSCNKDKRDNPAKAIIGEWQLLSVYQPLGIVQNSPHDVSDLGIIYTFGKNNVLEVVNEDGVVYPSGSYTYQVEKGHLGWVDDDSQVPKLDFVIIENTKWVYQRDGKKMILSNTYVDGPELTFEKK